MSQETVTAVLSLAEAIILVSFVGAMTAVTYKVWVETIRRYDQTYLDLLRELRSVSAHLLHVTEALTYFKQRWDRLEREESNED